MLIRNVDGFLVQTTGCSSMEVQKVFFSAKFLLKFIRMLRILSSLGCLVGLSFRFRHCRVDWYDHPSTHQLIQNEPFSMWEALSECRRRQPNRLVPRKVVIMVIGNKIDLEEKREVSSLSRWGLHSTTFSSPFGHLCSSGCWFLKSVFWLWAQCMAHTGEAILVFVTIWCIFWLGAVVTDFDRNTITCWLVDRYRSWVAFYFG